MEPYLIVLAQIEEQRVEVFQIEVKPPSNQGVADIFYAS